ncbi:MAG: hypothetical protein Q8N91_04370 [Candidatus Omnitrophota bacterium]|nr:hypothetical protein [Candidatus Omnitrophota bacterium]
MRRLCLTPAAQILSILFCLAFFCNTALCQEDENPLDKLNTELSERAKQADTFTQISREIGLFQRPEALSKILGYSFRGHMIVDDELVRKHFSGLDDALLSKILRQWNLPSFDAEEYLSIPFYIDYSKQEPRFVVSSKILNPNTPVSIRLYYISLLKAYASLPSVFKTSPSAWSHGISSLIAQDFFYSSSVANCPDLEIETAIAALLFHKNENLLWDLYPENETNFSKETYLFNLKSAIAAVGSEDPAKALEELLRSPEEYYAIGQKEVSKEAEKSKDDKGYAPPINPAMRILWMILPSNEEALRSTVDFVTSNVRNEGLSVVLLNACYDKLCALLGRSKEGLITDSSMLLSAVAEGWIGETGIDAGKLVDDFQRQRESVWNGLNDELSKRGQSETGMSDMAYDPSMMKWAFRFLYNYSLSLRQKQKELVDKVREENPGVKDDGINELAGKQLTVEMIRKRWRQDALLSKFLDRFGEPSLNLRECQASKSGKVLDCRWQLKRRGTNDIEEIVIHIVDPFSSGGGKPKPGVWARAKVVVRKDLNSDPVQVELGEVQKGFFVQTTNSLGDTDKMAQDWARVVTASGDDTAVPWQLESGAAQALCMGRKQKVMAKSGDDDNWAWMDLLSLRAKRDRLLGVKPEGAVPEKEKASFYPAILANTGPLQEGRQIIVLSLSHREVEAVKESGTDVWGYFADGRFAQTPVYPALEGVDGKGFIELPGGVKAVDELRAASGDKKGEQVDAFEFGSPKTFVDWIEERPSKIADFLIDITYTLPDGSPGSIRVAEGQWLVTGDGADEPVSVKRAYQLKRGSVLVCGFRQDKSPVTAVITNIEGREEKLGVYKIALTACPLVRINGILIPVKVPVPNLFPGVAEDSVIQLAPSLDIVRQSGKDGIDLKSAANKNAGNVVSGDVILAYNVDLEPRRTFYQLEIDSAEDYAADRYIRIVTPRATLDCGHQQGVFITKSGWDGVHLVPAGVVGPGDQVVWLGAGPGPKDSSIPNQPAAEAQSAVIELVTVTDAQVMYATKDRPVIALRDFLVPDTSKEKLGFKPNMFANGILVSVGVVLPGEGESGKGVGKMTGNKVEPRVPGKGRFKPASKQLIRESVPPEQIIKFDDPEQLERNRSELVTAFHDPGLRPGACNAKVINDFLMQYSKAGIESERIYSKIGSYLKDYLQARDFLVSTGNPRVLPGFVNAYVFLATLVYEADGKAAGDALTRDYLAILLRAVKGANWADGNIYAMQAFFVRDGLMLARDILVYARDKGAVDGFEPMAKVVFPSESFKNVLTDFFIADKGCSSDILENDNVRLYNLTRQLDKLYGVPMRIGESLAAPEFKASRLFQDPGFGSRLGISRVEDEGSPKERGSSTEEGAM